MKLEGRISILINREGTTIEIEDENANARFLKVSLTPEQLSMALSRQMSVECEIEVNALHKIGKRHENKSFEFEIPKDLASSRDAQKLQQIAQSLLSDGWMADNYFSSQNSFFKKGETQYARCTIRRWT
jgi:uncharacterized protein YggL (DUF469 family)